MISALLPVDPARYRGYFVPPRPEKNAVEGQRMADAFVEERRVALEQYMGTLAAHPAIAKSEVSYCAVRGHTGGPPGHCQERGELLLVTNMDWSAIDL